MHYVSKMLAFLSTSITNTLAPMYLFAIYIMHSITFARRSGDKLKRFPKGLTNVEPITNKRGGLAEMTTDAIPATDIIDSSA